MTTTKSDWSTLKMLLNNKQILCTPPLSHQNQDATGFKEKTDIFNSISASKCSLINNSSKLLSSFLKRTEKVTLSIRLAAMILQR